MSSQERGAAERRSFRCSVPAGQQEAVLEVGWGRYNVALLNESVEGCAVRGDRDLGVRPGDLVRLSTTFGRYEARVVYLEQTEPSRSYGSRGDRQYRLGLEWIRELDMLSAVGTLPPETQ
jgi:hypothetical protein